MNKQILTRSVALFALGLGLLLVLAPAAQAQDQRWKVRANYVLTEPSNDSINLGGFDGENNEFRVNSSNGFSLDIERMVNPKLGVFVSAIFADFEGEINGREIGGSPAIKDTDTVDFYTVNFGANYHFAPQARVDFYLGAFLGWFSHDSVTVDIPELGISRQLDFDDTFSYGLNGGIDVPFTRNGPALFHFGIKYVISDLKETSGDYDKMSIDPVFLEAGIGFRF